MKKRGILYFVIALFAVIAVVISFFTGNRIYFEGRFYTLPKELTSSMFQTSEDREFTEKFRKYTENEVLQWLKKKTIGEILGESQLKKLLKNAVEVGPNQYSGLYKQVGLCSMILHITPPRTFVIADPILDARIINPESPILIITSGLLETFSPEEIQFIIGHQLGHVMCEHVLPKTVAVSIIDTLKRYLPEKIATIAVPASCIALLKWTKDAEISADRAGLICCQREVVPAQALIRMLSGLSRDSYKRYGLPNIESFLDQRKESEKNALLNIVSLLGELDGNGGCRSFTATRVIELRDYARSREYRNIFKR